MGDSSRSSLGTRGQTISTRESSSRRQVRAAALERKLAVAVLRTTAEDLREQIESGRLEPGQQLLTELELREHYGASRTTIREAIKWLTTLGLVETKPGK